MFASVRVRMVIGHHRTSSHMQVTLRPRPWADAHERRARHREGGNTLRSSSEKSGPVVNTRLSSRWIRSRREAPAGPIIPRQKCHICTTSEVSNCPNQQSVKFGQQAECQICTTGEVSDVHNKQSVRRGRCVGHEGRRRGRGEDRLGMIGRVGSIGRIPAELVVSPAQPVSSMPSQRERDHTRTKAMPAP